MRLKILTVIIVTTPRILKIVICCLEVGFPKTVVMGNQCLIAKIVGTACFYKAARVVCTPLKVLSVIKLILAKIVPDAQIQPFYTIAETAKIAFFAIIFEIKVIIFLISPCQKKIFFA